jgi:O-succinylhomoserine sulfhydrylase
MITRKPAMSQHEASARPRHPETDLVHAGTLRSSFGETSEALFLTQGHVYDTAAQCEARFKGDDPGFIYARFSNPTVAMLEQRMAAFEGAQACRATATGMAAVTAALSGLLRAGDHIVAARALFGSCRYVIEEHFPRFGVTSSLVDGTDLDAWRAAIRPDTKLFFLESPANPTLEVIDIAAVADIARSIGAKLVVDNVFASPLFQRPLQLGADVVVYSATKHIDGQGRCLGGLILASEDLIQTHLQTFLRQTGPAMSPFNAWVMLKALETMPLRIRRQTETAGLIADRFARHAKVARLVYPGRADHPQADIIRRQMSGHSTLVAIEIVGGKAAAFRFLDPLRLIRISNNLGDAKSLVVHPGTTTHQRFTPEARAEMGIAEGLVRISAGLEHPDDIADDIETALQAV